MLLPVPFAWIKKILSILKSNLSPNQIAFAFTLGIFAGLPPMGLHVLIPATLALLFRCSFRAFLISLGLFKLVSLALAPASYAIGKWLLDTQRGADAFWRWLFHLPVVAPMGYSRYLLLGSLVVALVLAIPILLLIRWLVRRYRASFATRVSSWRVSRWLKGRKGTGLAQRVLAGGTTKYESAPPPRGIFRVIRREMLIGLPILYAVAYLVAAIVIPFFAGTAATSTVSWVVGTDVAVSDSSFNLLTGGLTLSDFTIQDPDAPDENLIAVPELKVDVGLMPLVADRLVLNSVVIADAELHVKREADGTLNLDNPSSGWNAKGYLEWAAQYAGSVDWLGLLRHLVDYLGQWEPLAPREDPYAAYGGGRTFPDYRPPFSIERLEIGRILVTLDDETASNTDGPLPPMTMLEVEISHWAFPAALRTEPIQLSLRGQWGDDPDSGFRLSATFAPSERGVVTQVEFALRRIDLPRLARVYATTLPVRIESGWASVSGFLRFDGESAEGETSFLLEDLELQASSDQALFGLPYETSEHVVEGINRYAADVPIVFGALIGGTSDAPELQWEAPLLQIAREGLMMAGRRELDRVIEELGGRVDRLGGIGGIPLDPSFEQIQQQTEAAAREVIEDAAGRLFQDFPLVQDLTGSPDVGDTEGSDEAGLSDLLPDLLENLLNPSSGDDNPDASASD
ncbi:TIGR03546 family protein [Candidatus Bipolaricaulota bacterium]|nr:TIGR03546 family protein [Candidatus Bipolaricaulota bacterium]TFH11019.1 MAG: TIGR03546 family protein [Candidatus Atribacteria bacterium]